MLVREAIKLAFLWATRRTTLIFTIKIIMYNLVNVLTIFYINFAINLIYKSVSFYGKHQIPKGLVCVEMKLSRSRFLFRLKCDPVFPRRPKVSFPLTFHRLQSASCSGLLLFNVFLTSGQEVLPAAGSPDHRCSFWVWLHRLYQHHRSW